MTTPPPQIRLSTQAASIALYCRVGGIPGIPQSDTVTLSTDDGKWRVTIDRTHAEFASFRLDPGALVTVFIGLSRTAAEQVVPDDPVDALRHKGLILPGRGGNVQ